jgi:transcriptional regulator with XRE-family HTH domain
MTLRQLRKERGLTLEAVAVLGDVDPATISRVERGLVQPQPETIVRLARALGISAKRMAAIVAETSKAAS